MGTQVWHGPDAEGLIKATATCWIAHIGMSVLDVKIDTLRYLVSKGVKGGSPNQSKMKSPFRQQP